MTTPDDHLEPPRRVPDSGGSLPPGAGPQWPAPSWPHVGTGSRPVDARPSWRATLRAALVTLIAVAAAGIPYGLLWTVLAPDVRVVQTRVGPLPVDPQPEQFVAADGWFALIGLGFGVTVAVAAWLVGRRVRGPVLLAAVVLSAVAAGAVAWQVGRLPGRGGFERWQDTAAAGAVGLQPADLRAYGVLLVPAFAAVITYTLLAGWSHDPELGVVDEPDWAAEYPFSSGSTAEPAATVAPGSPGSGAAAPPPG